MIILITVGMAKCHRSKSIRVDTSHCKIPYCGLGPYYCRDPCRKKCFMK